MNVATTLLGDRVQINSLSIADNQIVVDMVAQGPNDPICCPTQQVLHTYELQDDSLLPTCPNCGRPLFMNVRAAHWFLEAPYRGQAKRLAQWLSGLDERNLLIIEIGAGFNTPSVIRWPMEQLTAQRANTRFIRVNPNEHQVPDNIVDRTLTFACDANHFVNQCFSE